MIHASIRRAGPVSRPANRGARFTVTTAGVVLLSIGVLTQQRGVELANLTWVEAEQALTAETVVVIPLGAASKEHGPHLRLDNDYQLAEYLKRRVLAATAVVVAPTIPYHFYPAFLEYPARRTCGPRRPVTWSSTSSRASRPTGRAASTC